MGGSGRVGLTGQRLRYVRNPNLHAEDRNKNWSKDIELSTMFAIIEKIIPFQNLIIEYFIF